MKKYINLPVFFYSELDEAATEVARLHFKTERDWWIELRDETIREALDMLAACGFLPKTCPYEDFIHSIKHNAWGTELANGFTFLGRIENLWTFLGQLEDLSASAYRLPDANVDDKERELLDLLKDSLRAILLLENRSYYVEQALNLYGLSPAVNIRRENGVHYMLSNHYADVEVSAPPMRLSLHFEREKSNRRYYWRRDTTPQSFHTTLHGSLQAAVSTVMDRFADWMWERARQKWLYSFKESFYAERLSGHLFNQQGNSVGLIADNPIYFHNL